MKRRRLYRKKSIILIISILTNLIMLNGCAALNIFSENSVSGNEIENTIRIGIFEPLSGSDKEAGGLELKGIELAHKLYPEVLGKEVELVYADNKSEITTAESAAQELTDRNVDVILGSYGNTLSLAGGEKFQQAKIPAIAITCTNPLVTKGNPYYFRINIIDSFQGIMAAKYIVDELGLSKIAILKQAEDDYGAALSLQFTNKISSMTRSEDAIRATIEYKQGAENYNLQLEQIKASEAEAIYMPCPAAESAEIIRQAKASGVDAIFVGTDLWHEEAFIQGTGQAVEGVVFTTYCDAESAQTEKTEEFLFIYRAEYGEEEPPNSATALGFDAYLLALDAIERQAELQQREERKNISLRDVIASTEEYTGATGIITLDKNGDPIKSVTMISIENGEFVHKFIVHPELDEPTAQ